MAAAPVFAATPKIGHARISTANANRDGTGTVGDVYTGTTSGSHVMRIRIKATVTTTAGSIRFFIYDGTNSRLWDEVDVPVVTASASAAAFKFTIISPEPGMPLLILPLNYVLRACTEKAEQFDIIAHVMDV